jgi:ubiquinone/menaquinone biosynthesis C-methylase UbiE
MRRLNDDFLKKLTSVLSLEGKEVLEIGCGNGKRAAHIASLCLRLTAIDPDRACIAKAREMGIENCSFSYGKAEMLPPETELFDVILYTLSFHHVPERQMHPAIDLALTRLKPGGHLVFLEPAFEGSYFAARLLFDVCSPEERLQKQAGLVAMMSHPRLSLEKEIPDETKFYFDSAADFIESMRPKKDLNQIASFLRMHEHVLNAWRRICIFSRK